MLAHCQADGHRKKRFLQSPAFGNVSCSRDTCSFRRVLLLECEVVCRIVHTEDRTGKADGASPRSRGSLPFRSVLDTDHVPARTDSERGCWKGKEIALFSPSLWHSLSRCRAVQLAHTRLRQASEQPPCNANTRAFPYCHHQVSFRYSQVVRSSTPAKSSFRQRQVKWDAITGHPVFRHLTL
jgi:hypothetical protein